MSECATRGGLNTLLLCRELTHHSVVATKHAYRTFDFISAGWLRSRFQATLEHHHRVQVAWSGMCLPNHQWQAVEIVGGALESPNLNAKGGPGREYTMTKSSEVQCTLVPMRTGDQLMGTSLLQRFIMRPGSIEESFATAY